MNLSNDASESQYLGKNHIDISLIIGVFGNYLLVLDEVKQLYKQLTTLVFDGSIELILVVSGRELESGIFDAVRDIPRIKLLTVEEKIFSPATLFNRGALNASGEYLSFIWPGVDLAHWQSNWPKFRERLSVNQESYFLAGNFAPTSLQKNTLQTWLRSAEEAFPIAYPAGWLEMCDFVPMECSIVHRQTFLNQHGFSTSILLQRGFWWEYTVRYARKQGISFIDIVPPPAIWSWYEYPLCEDLCLSGDLIARRVIRYSQAPKTLFINDDWHEEHFWFDLPVRDRTKLTNKLLGWGADARIVAERKSPVETRFAEPLKIIVLGGLNEPAHNQLCFYNYFARTEGKSELTWRAILETTASIADLSNANLVIFSRAKTAQACLLMQFCQQQKIPTLYMLDDNWFSIGKEWPMYREVFWPGLPLFDNAVFCIQKADCVLTYNQTLAEDLEKYTQKVCVIPPNIDLSLFPSKQAAAKRKITIGYVGSARLEDSAFQALVQLAEERDDFDLFIMSTSLPDLFAKIPDERIVFQPYVFSYSLYAQIMSDVSPDILLAPLGDTRTEQSKCPNKYFEITASGAVGVYSNVKPYSEYVKHGINGLLVPNDASAWKQAIEQLLNNQDLCESMHNSAMFDVKSNFHTDAVLDIFLEKLKNTATTYHQSPRSAASSRIAFVAHSSLLTGAARVLTDLLEFLPRDGIEPVVLFPKNDGPLKHYVREQLGIPVFELDYEIILQSPSFKLMHSQINLFGDFIRETSIDLLIVNTTVLEHAVMAAAWNGTPCLLHSHGTINFSDAREQSNWFLNEERQLQLADHCAVPSLFTARTYSALYEAHKEKITVVSNGTKIPPHVSPTNDELLFVLLCTLEPNKGPQHFLEAARRALTSRPKKMKFAIYGDGIPAHKKQLEEFIIAHDLSDCCTLHPKQVDIGAIYNRCSAVIIASQLESFSLVAIEAMSYGRPVITTRCGGPENIVEHDVHGYHVDIDDIEALAKRIIYLVDHPHEITRLGRSGRETVIKQYNVQTIASAAYYPLILRVQANAPHHERMRENRRTIRNYLASIKQSDVKLNAPLHAEKTKKILRTSLKTGIKRLKYTLYSIKHAIKYHVQAKDLSHIIAHKIHSLKLDAISLTKISKITISPLLNNKPFIEYSLSVPNTKFNSISIACENRHEQAGLIGIEIVLPNGQIGAHVVHSITSVNFDSPIKFVFPQLSVAKGAPCLVRVFVKDAPFPIFTYECRGKAKFSLRRTRLKNLLCHVNP